MATKFALCGAFGLFEIDWSNKELIIFKRRMGNIVHHSERNGKFRLEIKKLILRVQNRLETYSFSFLIFNDFISRLSIGCSLQWLNFITSLLGFYYIHTQLCMN